MNNIEIGKGFLNFIPGGDTLSIALLYFIGSSIFSFIIAPLIINLMYKLEITRKAKGDKISKIFDENNGKNGTPIMGGLIFIIAIVVVTLMFNWKRDYTWIPIGVLILSAVIGGIDDILNIFGKNRNLPKPVRLHIKLAFVHKSYIKRFIYFLTIPWAIFKRISIYFGSKPNSGLMVYEKITLQFIVGLTIAFWIYYKLDWTYLWVPSILSKQEWFVNFIKLLGAYNPEALYEYSSIDIGWLIVPFIVFIVILISNAVNITDGMDGLAGGLSFISFTSYAVIAFGISEYGKLISNYEMYGLRSIVYLCATASGALLAYLYFNAKPARIQMGDLGSLSIGTLICTVAIILNRELTLFLIAGVFLIDSIISRIIQAIYKKLFHKKLFEFIPLHYHFAIKGWPEEKVVTRFWIISIILSAIGIWLAGI